ncbi:MAG: hypothetical protein ACOZNI_17635 [Myxococcota bacterium]
MLCPDDGMPVGPVQAGFYDGDLGVARRACHRTEVGLAGGGLVVADLANFYGHLVAGGTLDASWAATERVEVFASVEAFRYDTVLGAIPAEHAGLGHTAIGGSWAVRDGAAVTGRVVLPTAAGLYENAFPYAFDVGMSFAREAGPLVAHAAVYGLGSFAASKGPAFPRAGLSLTLGGEWRPVKPFALALDLTSGLGYTAGLDHVAAGIGLRGALGKRGGIELAATVPLAGEQRALATAELRGSVQFD